MVKTKVYFVDYDAKAGISTIFCREAQIDENKDAHIKYRPSELGGTLVRKAGSYIEAEEFNLYWHRALEDKCKAMIADGEAKNE